MTENERNMQQRIEELEKQVATLIGPMRRLVQAVDDKNTARVRMNEQHGSFARRCQQNYFDAERRFYAAIEEQCQVVKGMGG